LPGAGCSNPERSTDNLQQGIRSSLLGGDDATLWPGIINARRPRKVREFPDIRVLFFPTVRPENLWPNVSIIVGLTREPAGGQATLKGAL
jgi:hypothetical protein